MTRPPNYVLGRRAVAMIIDMVVFDAILLGLLLIGLFVWAGIRTGLLAANTGTAAPVDTPETVILSGAAYLVSLVLGLLYWVVPIATTGATLGKLVTGIRVVGPDLSPRIGFRRALVRQLLWIADALPYSPPFLTGLVVAAIRRDRRRIGDLVARTTVVRRDSL